MIMKDGGRLTIAICSSKMKLNSRNCKRW